MKRAEVWWAELPPPVGARPVVILTRDSVVNLIGSIVVSLITRSQRQLPTEVALGRREGLPRPCVASMDNLLTVPRQRLTHQLGALSKARVEELIQALRVALDLA